MTLRSVGSNGGQAAAFTYDLARSVVYTRQGNPAWAGQERDSVVGIRPDDMFFGGAQTDWVDTNKIAIPQADEQQRLLLNLITQMERDRLPLPHFWYLPRGERAAVVMSGDDHSPSQAPGGTVANFNRFKRLSPAGCVVANWECVRATSYIYPNSAITNAQAAGYLTDGFETALHPLIASCPTSPITESALAAIFDSQLASWKTKYVEPARPGLEPQPLRLLARLGVEREGAARARDPDGRELLPLPRELDRHEERVHDRRRLPDALRGRRRHADRRLPRAHAPHRRVDVGVRHRDRCAPRQRGRSRRGTTEPSE